MTNFDKKTLDDQLRELREYDDDLLPEEFDVEKAVGDLKNKIDAIRLIILEWEAKAETLENNVVIVFEQRVKAIRGKAQRLREYVKASMLINNVEKIPGSLFRAQVKDSKPRLEINEIANAHFFLSYPEFVTQQVQYNWNKEVLREELEKGHTLTFAELKKTKSLNFYAMGDKEK